VERLVVDYGVFNVVVVVLTRLLVMDHGFCLGKGKGKRKVE
jgi:hypothetical protein